MRPRPIGAVVRATFRLMAPFRISSWRQRAIVAVLPLYGVVYLSWYVLRWGPAGAQLAIADASFLPIGLYAVVAAFAASRRATSSGGRRAWAFIGLGFAAYAFGDLAWFWFEVVQAREVPFPSVADIGYLAFFPFMLLGLASLPRERLEGRLRAWLDMAIVLIGSGAAVWWLVLGPVVASTGGDPLDVLLGLIYPVGDTLVLFALLAALSARLMETSRAVVSLLAIGLALNIAADLTYARLVVAQTYTSGMWLDLVYILGWVALGSAAVLQGVASYRRAPAPGAPPLRPITFLPYLAIVAVYGLLADATFSTNNGDRVLVAGAIAVTALVVVRQILTARENARLMTVEASAREAARFQALIKNASDVILVTDAGGLISFATPSARGLFGRDPAGLEGGPITALVAVAEAPRLMVLLKAAATRSGISGPSAFQVQAPEERWVEIRISNLLDNPLVSGLVATVHDITERRAFEQQLEAQALHDPLTNLANRVLFADRVGQAVVRARRSRMMPTVLYLDLDDFKQINDTLGHTAGDEVLIEISHRILATIRGEDTAGRLGGDEFAVLIDGTRDIGEAEALAERLEAAFAPPFEAGGSRFSIKCSIGIVRADRVDASYVELLRNADIAMYAAKRDARGGHQVFQPAMYAATVERARLEADLRDALGNGEFRLLYQPLIDLATQELNGVEALLRWEHPRRGLVMPNDFIAAAESCGEIGRIGKWVLEEVCRTVGGWNAALGDRAVKANVNVSLPQLVPGFVVEVAAILAKTGFPPDYLVIEITESVFTADRGDVIAVLNDLRALGIRISLDDFGTGYSSLSRLRDLPVDELKIDRAFVQQLTTADQGSLVSTILQIARDLSLGTVAEGVEEPEQMERLRELGCDLGQGFLLGRPMEATVIESLIAGAEAARPALSRSA
jgi:diguanylate cyclase (GGDEF)-like protein/PAS domain S-box-containing protein